MKIIFAFLISVFTLTGVFSCGGGGGGGGSGEEGFAGRYLLSEQSLIEDSCGLGLPETLSDTTTIRVDQVDDSVAVNVQTDQGVGFLPLITNAGLVGVRYGELRRSTLGPGHSEYTSPHNFSGIVHEGGNGFIARTQEYQDNQCTSNYILELKSSDQPDIEFETSYRFTVDCPSRSCAGSYSGSASRRPPSRPDGGHNGQFDGMFRTRTLQLVTDSCNLGLRSEIGSISNPYYLRRGDQIDIRSLSFLPRITDKSVLNNQDLNFGSFTAVRAFIYYTGSFNSNGFEVTNQFVRPNPFTDRRCVTNSRFTYFNDGSIEFGFLIDCPNRVCEGLYTGTGELTTGGVSISIN